MNLSFRFLFPNRKIHSRELKWKKWFKCFFILPQRVLIIQGVKEWQWLSYTRQSKWKQITLYLQMEQSIKSGTREECFCTHVSKPSNITKSCLPEGLLGNMPLAFVFHASYKCLCFMDMIFNISRSWESQFRDST